MNGELIRETSAKLRIVDAWLTSQTTSVSPSFDPMTQEGPTATNFQWGVAQIEVADAEDENRIILHHRVRATFEGVARLFRGKPEDLGESKVPSQESVIAELKSRFIIEYHYSHDNQPSTEGLNEFCIHNAAIHVWPYWREWLSSTAARMRLPLITLPFSPVRPSNK